MIEAFIASGLFCDDPGLRRPSACGVWRLAVPRRASLPDAILEVAVDAFDQEVAVPCAMPAIDAWAISTAAVQLKPLEDFVERGRLSVSDY